MDFGGDTSGLLTLEEKLRAASKPAARKQLGAIVASAIQHEIDGEFRGGHAPDGTPWAPKKPISGTGPTLVGQSISGSVTVALAGSSVTATIGGWSAVHQRGITIFPKRPGGVLAFNGIFARKVTIPARRMVPDEGALPDAWDSAMQRAAGFKLEGMLK